MAQELKSLDKEKLVDYWNYNKKLTFFTLAIWFVVTYVCSFFAAQLNKDICISFDQLKISAISQLNRNKWYL